jgi:uncharacterized protein (DUF302 family)
VLTNLAIAESRYEQIEVYRAETTKPFDEVVADAEFAISEQNFTLTGRSEIGKAIGRLYAEEFPEVTALQFCNLELAREILSVLPKFSLHMPCKIVIYQQADKVIIETQLHAFKSANLELNMKTAEIKRQIRDIVDFASTEH